MKYQNITWDMLPIAELIKNSIDDSLFDLGFSAKKITKLRLSTWKKMFGRSERVMQDGLAMIIGYLQVKEKISFDEAYDMVNKAVDEAKRRSEIEVKSEE